MPRDPKHDSLLALKFPTNVNVEYEASNIEDLRPYDYDTPEPVAFVGDSPHSSSQTEGERHVKFEKDSKEEKQKAPSKRNSGLMPSKESKDTKKVSSSEDFTVHVQTLLNPTRHMKDIHTTYYSSAYEANRALSHAGNTPEDRTVPRTLGQRKAIVKALCSAIEGVDLAQDNPNMIKPFETKKYSDEKIEAASWNILVTLS